MAEKDLTTAEVTKWMAENYRPPGDQPDALSTVMGAVKQAGAPIEEPFEEPYPPPGFRANSAPGAQRSTIGGPAEGEDPRHWPQDHQ